MVEQDLLHFTMNGYLLDSAFARKTYRAMVCVFLLGQINVSVKLIFLVTARSRTLKSVQFN
jgi:hypothetical protein